MTTLPVIVTRSQHRDARTHCEAADDASLTSTGLMLYTCHGAQRVSARPPDVKHPDLSLEPTHDGVTILMDGDGVGVGQLVQVIDTLVGPLQVESVEVVPVEVDWLVPAGGQQVVPVPQHCPAPAVQALRLLHTGTGSSADLTEILTSSNPSKDVEPGVGGHGTGVSGRGPAHAAGEGVQAGAVHGLRYEQVLCRETLGLVCRGQSWGLISFITNHFGTK